MGGHHAGRYTPKVAIIGAGVSGLAAAKHLAKFDPVVFEASGSIGGVWKHCSYRSTRLQTPRMDYEFSDYRWQDRNDTSFPTHTEIVEYLCGYTTHFNLWNHIRFNCKVVEMRYLGDGDKDTETEVWGSTGRPFSGRPMWEIGVHQTEPDEAIQWYKFDFVVMCLGKYGDVPNMPAFSNGKGPEVFNGKLMHSMNYCKLNKQESQELMKGKKVVVVGYKKSAIDLAVECADANQGPDGQSCTMLIRTLHWTVPSYSIWGLPFFLFYATRFSQFIHERPNQGMLRSLFCQLSSPMRKSVSKFIESYLCWRLPLDKYGLRPNHPFQEDYASCQMAILPDNFFEEADKGMIEFKKSQSWSFWEGGVVLDDNSKLEADVVFLATGFNGKSKLKYVLPDPFRGLLDDFSGLMPLYRGTIHPKVPHMAFVGYIESVSNLHTAELRCKWLSRLLDEHFTLPSVSQMLSQTAEEEEVMRKTTRFYKRHCISTFSINHSDEICEEMGWESWRKNGWLSEAFSPYNNQDYLEAKDSSFD